MATARALAATGEIIQNTELVVTSALAFDVYCTLPPIDNGAGATVAADYTVTLWANSTGSIRVLDQYGHLLSVVRPGESRSFCAVGTVAANSWSAQDNARTIPLKASTEELAIGAGAAIAFGATTPGGITTPATINRFLKITLSDGTVGKIPVWV